MTAQTADKGLSLIKFYSREELKRKGARMDPVETQAVAARAWTDIRSGRAYGIKSVLSLREAELWENQDLLIYRDEYKEERLGWKLSALCSVNPSYGGVKIIGANALNRRLGRPRSTSTILLLDKITLTPLCLLDGTELSAARTATYPVMIADQFRLLEDDAIDVFLFGAGPVAEKIILAFDAIYARQITRLYIRSRTGRSAVQLVERLSKHVSLDLIPTTSNNELSRCRMVITASNANGPVLAANELHPRVVLVHLGGDETPAEYVQHALRRGTVCCDDLVTTSRRGSQSLPLYFSRKGSSLEEMGPLLGVRNLAEIDVGLEDPQDYPVLVTCVGLPVLDLYLAQFIYERFLGHSDPADVWS